MAPRPSAAMHGIAFMLAGSFFMSLNNAILKWLSTGYPAGQILFLRSSFIFVAIGVFIWRAGGFRLCLRLLLLLHTSNAAPTCLRRWSRRWKVYDILFALLILIRSTANQYHYSAGTFSQYTDMGRQIFAHPHGPGSTGFDLPATKHNILYFFSTYNGSFLNNGFD